MNKTLRQAINRSKIKRFPYKKMLGESLTSYLDKHFKGGYRPGALVPMLEYEMKKFYIYFEANMTQLPLIKALENLKISISARWIEWKRHHPEARE